MKVLNTYIVEVPSGISSITHVLFECENDKWFLQRNIPQGGWMTIIEPISAEEAAKLIQN